MKLSLLAALLVPLSVLAEPITLKGLAPGMTKEQLEAAHKGFTALCFASIQVTGGESCGYVGRKGSLVDIPALETFAGAPAIRWQAILKNGAANVITVSLKSDHFDRVTAALVEKWGKPTDSEASSVHNRMGASFDQIETTWAIDGMLLKAQKRGRLVDEMTLSLTTPSAMQDMNRDRTQVQPKANAKDM